MVSRLLVCSICNIQSKPKEEQRTGGYRRNKLRLQHTVIFHHALLSTNTEYTLMLCTIKEGEVGAGRNLV